jgi:hypothetical protein
MESLARGGANCIRVWLAPWWLPIESAPGSYDQGASARLDLILLKAESLRLRVILCIEQHGNFEEEGAEIALWNKHPYNAANGGPCRNPVDFFTDSVAQRLFKNRLRYLVARWGYSTSLMAWELFNEVEFVPFEGDRSYAKQDLLAAWHQEMAKFLRACDPFHHLVATSADARFQRGLVQSGALDFLQLHVYEKGDLAGKIQELASPLAAEIDAPVFVGEFGGAKEDKDCRFVTRGIFAAALSGAGSGALAWLQDTPDITPCQRRLRAARDFFGPVRWKQERFASVKPTLRTAGERDGGAEPGQGHGAEDASNLHALAQVGQDEAHVYIYDYSAEAAPDARPPSSVRLFIPRLKAGAYALEFWNCSDGKVLDRQVVRPALAGKPGEGGKASAASPPAGLQIELPYFGEDIAVKLALLRAAP